MTSDWCAGAIRIGSGHNGGSMLGGPPRFTMHTYEAGYGLSAVNGARSLIRAGNEVHFVFHPTTGELVQILPASVAGRALRNPSGGVQTNRCGTVHLQVEVVGRAARPWTADLTAAGRRGLARMVGFARAHGIPDRWPAGRPPAYPGGESVRSASTWLHEAGWYGHSQVPENTHGDPGAIDVRAIFVAAPTAPPAPAPHPPWEQPMFFRATSASADGSVVAGGIYSCVLNQRAHISGLGAPLVRAYVAAGYKIPDVGGQDIVDAFPYVAPRPDVAPRSAAMDVSALAAEVAADLAAQVVPGGATVTTEQIATVLRARLAPS